MNAPKTSLHTTSYSFVNTTPCYAVRRVQDGWYLNEDGEFQEISHRNSRNDGRVDKRTSSEHWEERGTLPEGCEVVALAEVVTITAVPVKW